MLGKKLTAAVEAKILTNVMSNYVSKGGSRVEFLFLSLKIYPVIRSYSL